ncbi:ribonuclease H-like domain-containing protein [Tanacetum coccineum]
MDLETAQTNATAKLPILKQGPVTTEEKAQKKNDVKARSMLLITLPNEHLLTFNQYRDAKTLFDAIQTRFGGNDATKKTQKTLLKQMNKSDLDTMSIDDLYNNFKIIEQEVKRTFSTANSPVSTADTPDSTANLSDATVYAFLALLSMRARRYFQRTSKKITINGSDTAGYDKSKVECFNCHKMGHFARECRGPRNQDNRNRNQDSSRRTVNVEETSSKAMVAIDGAATYKRGLASVEEQLVFYKKNEVMFYDQIAVLKRDTSFKDSEINALKSEIEKLKKEKESNQIKIDKFENASKSLDKLIGSQISDNSRKGVGFEFQQPEFEDYGPKGSKSVCKNTSNEVKKTLNAPLSKKLVSEKEKQTVFPTKIESVKQQEKPARKPVKLMLLRPQHVGFGDLPNLTGHPQKENQGYVDSGHMTGNMSYLSDFKEFDGGYVTFGGGARGGRITGKRTLKTGKLDFEDVYFVKEL